MIFFKINSLLIGLPLVWSAPPVVPGFALTWSDDFIGSAKGLPNIADRIVDSGTSYPGGAFQWGTGEIQTYTSRPENVKLTGDGILRITPIRDLNNQWTSARIETTRSNFKKLP
jgi:hypothetical protein